MAMHKFPKAKTFHLDYCGCTAAALLLNEPSIREALNLVRQSKSKREFVRTKLSISRDGVKIVYEDEQNYSTSVPAAMIAGATTGKAYFRDTVGVVYISPLTGRHYPAFVHVYRCESSRAAQKLLIRFRAYTFLEDHRSQIAQLEQKLLEHNLLTVDHSPPVKVSSPSPTTTTLESTRTNTVLSSSSASSGSRPEKIDPVKSITEELQKKIDSHEPLLFPPKDYDTIHAGHGHVQRAQAWKSTEPTVVGYTSFDPDNQGTRQRQTPTDYSSSSKKSTIDELETIDRPRFSSQRSDASIDPVETISLAFQFLKDETDSITTNNDDDDIEPLETEEQDKMAVFRFRPPPITAITKKLFPRTNNYELHNDLSLHNSAAKNDLNAHHGHAHQYQQRVSNTNRARSETNLHHEPQPRMHFSPRYENRLVNRNGAPIPTNPLWTSASPAMVGSQPNLLARHSPILKAPVRRILSPPTQRRMTSIPLQHPLYTVHSSNNSSLSSHQTDNTPKQQSVPITSSNTKPTSSTKYLDTNEFILRAANGSLLNNSQYPSWLVPGPPRNHRAQTTDGNTNSNAMLDVYY